MYPDLSYLFHDLFGTPVDNWTSLFKTFGLFLALAIFIAAWIFRIELKRKADEGLLTSQKVLRKKGEQVSTLDLIFNVVVSFVLGYKLAYIINHFSLFQADATAVLFSGRGSVIGGVVGVLAIAGPMFWRKWRNRDEEVKK